MIVDGPCDILDHATPYYGTGAKIGIDATRKIAGEGVVREWPEELEMSGEVAALVERRRGGVWVLKGGLAGRAQVGTIGHEASRAAGPTRMQA